MQMGLEEHEGDGCCHTPSSPARWREDFPHQAGRHLHQEPTVFESQHKAQVARGESIWGKFSNERDWTFAQWILKSGTSQAYTNELLDIVTVSKPVVDPVKDLQLKHVADLNEWLCFIP